MIKFLEKKIDGEEFKDIFVSTYVVDRNKRNDICSNWEILSKFEINDELPDISTVLVDLFIFCKGFKHIGYESRVPESLLKKTLLENDLRNLGSKIIKKFESYL